MNLGKDFLLSQGSGVPYNADSWVPVTPQKPVMWDSNPNPERMQGNQRSNHFPELLQSCSRFLPEKPVMQRLLIQNSEWQTNQRASSSLETLLSGQSNLSPEEPAVQSSDTIVAERHGNHMKNENWQKSKGVFSTFSPQMQNTTSGAIATGMQGNHTDSTNWRELIGVYSDLLQQSTPSDAFQHLKSTRLLGHGEANIQGNPLAEVNHHSANSMVLQPNHTLGPNNGRSSCNLQQTTIVTQPRETTYTNMQETQNNCDQLLQSVVASASSNSTPLKEKHVLEDGGYEGIDLNKTPELKTPKRKKHRPKVVVEGKPKRMPKPASFKTKTSTEIPSGKRKYVRKNGLKDSTSEQDNETKPVEFSSVHSGAKSCRRVLNFGIEDKTQGKSQDKTGDNEPVSRNEFFDLNLTAQGTTSSMGLNRISTIPAAQEEQQKRYNAVAQQSGSPCNIMNSTNQKSTLKFLPLAPITPTATARDHTLNVIARALRLQNATTCHTNDQHGYHQVHQQIHGKAIGQMPLQANGALDKQQMLQTRIRSVEDIAEANLKRGYKRDYCNISNLTHSPTVNLMHLQLIGNPMNNRRKTVEGNSETHKKKKLEDKCQEAGASLPSCSATANYSSRQIESRGSCGVHVSCSAYVNGRLPYSNLEMQHFSRKQTSDTNGITNDQYMGSVTVGNNFQEQKPLSGVKLQRDCMAGQFFLQHKESRRPSLLTGTADQNTLSQPQIVLIQANETTTHGVNKVVKRQMVGLESTLIPFNKEKAVPKDYKKEPGYLPFSEKAREFGAGQNEEQKFAVKVEDVISQLKGLQINNNVQTVVREEQTCLVPYKGNGTIVPYEEFNPIKRRKQRPKVDLDPETNQLWDLLMVKSGNESTKTMDKDKEKWWEDERRVFCGRVDSFIARMHLLQGDRRFSRWKGSIVDSVVGVFLTQNVTDHLSSSAFMSLAAKFPPQRTLNPTSPWIEEPEVQIIDPDGTITYYGKILRQPLYKENSRMFGESSERGSYHLITGEGVHLVNQNNRATEEEVVSSQNSSESLILQGNEDVQSSSDSEVQDQVIMCNANKSQSPTSVLQIGHKHSLTEPLGSESTKIPNLRKRKLDEKIKSIDWDTLRKQVLSKVGKQRRDKDKMDSLDYEALRRADIEKVSVAIKERGMNNMLAERIKDFLNRLVRDHGSIDLEWLRDVPPDKAKEYLLSIRGLGLKSVECVRLLTLHHMAFPVDTNVGRIAVRLGWVPLQPLPEELQLHLLELYPVLESIQKYLWPRLCKLDQRTLYELHYQMITFGKVFCTKKNPNCNACPMRPECRHFASAFASARLALPGPEEKGIASSTIPMAANGSPPVLKPMLEKSIVSSTILMAANGTPAVLKPMVLTPLETNAVGQSQYLSSQQEPIIEEPSTPEISTSTSESDIEDLLSEDTDEIPTIDLSFEQLKMNVQSILQERKMEITEGDLSRALVPLHPANASIPAPKLKNVSRLRTEHQVYEIPDSHPLVKGMDRREPDDPSPYLLAIWIPGETANSTEPPDSRCSCQGTGSLCNEKTCSTCNSVREANSHTVRGTLLIPCRTAMRGSFPLNGTYFQVNEVFADHESSINPIEVPRDWLWPLRRRTVYFGTSVSTIFKGLSQIEIQYCFWKGFVCVRGFELKTRAPRPLAARLHFPASKKAKSKNEKK